MKTVNVALALSLVRVRTRNLSHLDASQYLSALPEALPTTTTKDANGCIVVLPVLSAPARTKDKELEAIPLTYKGRAEPQAISIDPRLLKTEALPTKGKKKVGKTSETQYESLKGAKVDARFSDKTGDGKALREIEPNYHPQAYGPFLPTKALPTIGEFLPLLYTGRIFATSAPNTSHKLTKKEKLEETSVYADLTNTVETSDGTFKAQHDPITCPALFLKGEKETDGFSRTMALRFLSKRLVYSPKSNSKSAPTKLNANGTRSLAKLPKALKGSGSHVDPRFTKEGKQSAASAYRASDVEDLIQEAFVIFLTGSCGNWQFKTTGNRLADTCNACRMALQRFNRTRYAERKALDIVQYNADLRARGHTTGKRNERSIANDIFDDGIELEPELAALLSAVRQIGSVKQKALSAELGISQGEVSKRLECLRTRLNRQEA